MNREERREYDKEYRKKNKEVIAYKKHIAYIIKRDRENKINVDNYFNVF